MPAYHHRGEVAGPWVPHPDFVHDYQLDASFDDAYVDFNDEIQVSSQLRDTDPTIAAYEFTLSEDDLLAMALESAKGIIEKRNALLDERRQATARSSDEERPLPTIVVPFVRDARTGERLQSRPTVVKRSRSFG